MALSSLLIRLADPVLVVGFQKLCGVEYLPDDLQLDGDEAPSAATGFHSNHEAARDERNGNGVEHSNGCVKWRGKQQTAISKDSYASTNNNNNNESEEQEHASNGSLKMANGYIKQENGYTTNHNHRQYDSKSILLNGVAPANSRQSEIRRCTEGSPVTTGDQGYSSSNPSRCHNHSSATGGSAPVNLTPAPCPRVLISYPALYYVAQVGAFLGNEEFYLTGLPFILWMVDSAMLRQVSMVWWMVMYLGQASKDYMGWPRPPSPPVVRLEFSHLAEFSMPSTHAMAGTAIPLVLAKLLLERYDLPTIPVVIMAFLWCSTTCFSRLYLGVHTVLDLLAGIVIALGVYVIACPLTGRVDLYQQTNTLAPIALIAASLALCTICYPSQHKSAAKADAITTTAVIVGVGIGSWLNYQLGYSVMVPAPVRFPVSLPSLWWLVMSVLQFVVGVVVVYSLKVAIKALTVRFFSTWYGLDRPDSKHPYVMVGYVYTTYCALGLAIAFFDPLIFTALGFGRPSYYTEVL